MTASSPRRRARIVAGSVLVAGLLAVSGCSAGQETQTSTQVAAVPGANADAGVVALRNLTVVYHGIEGYPAGSNAPLDVNLVNTSGTAVKLTGVTSPGAQAVVLAGGTGGEAEPAAATASASPSAKSEEGTATESPGAEATPSAAPAAGKADFSINLPASTFVGLAPGGEQYLLLTKLKEPLVPGQSIPVTFSFSDGSRATVLVPMGSPTKPAPRSPMNIHEEE